MNFFKLLLLLLVYIGGTDLFAENCREGKRFLWPVIALIGGFRKASKAIRELFEARHIAGS